MIAHAFSIIALLALIDIVTFHLQKSRSLSLMIRVSREPGARVRQLLQINLKLDLQLNNLHLKDNMANTRVMVNTFISLPVGSTRRAVLVIPVVHIHVPFYIAFYVMLH